MNKKYIGYQGEVAVFVRDSREELESIPFVTLDRIEEHDGPAELIAGELLLDEEAIKRVKAAAIQAQYTAMVQFILDTEAQKLGYDNCLSVCSYIDTGIAKYDAEGKSFRSWRSDVWNKAFELLGQIKAGEVAMPTEDELKAYLPELVIDYEAKGYTI